MTNIACVRAVRRHRCSLAEHRARPVRVRMPAGAGYIGGPWCGQVSRRRPHCHVALPEHGGLYVFLRLGPCGLYFWRDAGRLVEDRKDGP